MVIEHTSHLKRETENGCVILYSHKYLSWTVLVVFKHLKKKREKVLNATEYHILNWLKWWILTLQWWILCVFATIKPS